MKNEKLGFHEWALKYGNEADKDTFRGSGLPTAESRKIEKKAYGRYSKYLESEKPKSYGHECLVTNPLENPEMFQVRSLCNKCNTEFGMSLIRHNQLRSNSGFFSIEKRTELKLCLKCYKIYLKKQNELRKRELPTDIEVGELAEAITKHPYGWEYQLGFIDGFIKMRDMFVKDI